MFKNISIKKVLISLILSVSIVPFVILVFFFGRWEYDRQLNSALENKAIYNETLGLQLESEIKRFTSLLLNKSDVMADVIAKEKHRTELMSLMEQIILRDSVIQNLLVIDESRNIITTFDARVKKSKTVKVDNVQSWVITNWGLDTKKSVSEIETLLKGHSYISQVRIKQTQRMFTISIPIGNPDQPLGIVLADISISDLWRQLNNSDKLPNTITSLIDSNGRLLLSDAQSYTKTNKSFKKVPIVQESLQNLTWNKRTIYKNMLGVDVFGVVTHVPNLDWLIVSEIAKSHIVEPIEESIRTAFIMTALFILFFVVVGLYVTNRILKPMNQLTTAMNNFAEGDFSHDIASTDIIEFNELLSGFNHMVKQRSHSEQALRLSKQRLQLHRDQSPLGVIECDKKFVITDWNAAAETIFGYTRLDALGRDAREIIFPNQNSNEETDHWQQMLLNNININVTKKGEEIICNWYNTPLISNDGKIIGVTSIIEDVTQQHEAEIKLREQDKEKQLILDNMVVSVIVFKNDGVIKNVNRMTSTIFGYTQEELLDKNVNILMEREIIDKHNQFIGNYQNNGDNKNIGFSRELEGKRKNGECFPMRLSVSELPRDISGNSYYIGSCYDLTEDKLKDEQLRRSQKMDALGKLTGGIAHDYNNMLGVILGYSEMLQAKLKDDPKLIRYASEIQRAGERSKKLTGKLLAFSRPALPISETINLNSILNDQKDLLEKTLTAKIKLNYQLSENLHSNLLDVGDLQDAILNIAINAKHAMPDGGSLKITTKNKTLSNKDAVLVDLPSGEYVELSIEDNGIGMDPNTQQQIFDPFYSTKGDLGTGLGLSQVFGFVKRARGNISVDSQPGIGTRFRLYFPSCFDVESENQEQNEKPKMKEKHDEKILVVDDESALRQLACDILEKEGYHVTSADSAEAALELLKQESIDLILSDVIMPGIDGYKLADSIHRDFPKLSVLLMSGYNDEGTSISNDFLRSLRDNLLKKPYSIEELIQSVHKTLNQR